MQSSTHGRCSRAATRGHTSTTMVAASTARSTVMTVVARQCSDRSMVVVRVVAMVSRAMAAPTRLKRSAYCSYCHTRAARRVAVRP
jgi:hypothetical protein